MKKNSMEKLCALMLSMIFASSALSSFPLQKAGAYDSRASAIDKACQ